METLQRVTRMPGCDWIIACTCVPDDSSRVPARSLFCVRPMRNVSLLALLSPQVAFLLLQFFFFLRGFCVFRGWQTFHVFAPVCVKSAPQYLCFYLWVRKQTRRLLHSWWKSSMSLTNLIFTEKNCFSFLILFFCLKGHTISLQSMLLLFQLLRFCSSYPPSTPLFSSTVLISPFPPSLSVAAPRNDLLIVYGHSGLGVNVKFPYYLRGVNVF